MAQPVRDAAIVKRIFRRHVLWLQAGGYLRGCWERLNPLTHVSSPKLVAANVVATQDKLGDGTMDREHLWSAPRLKMSVPEGSSGLFWANNERS